MLGPVLSLELLLASRRGRSAMLRRIYAAFLLVQFAICFGTFYFALPESYRSNEGTISFLYFVVQILLIEHFAVLLMIAPGTVAGAITDEKLARTLQYLFTADLTSWEIVIGKLLGRILSTAALAGVSLPFFAFLAGFSQTTLIALLGLIAVTFVVLCLLGSLSMWASVRVKQTREAVVRVYLQCGIFAVGMTIFLGFVIPYLLTVPGARSAWTLRLLAWADFLRSLDPIGVVQVLWQEADVAEFARRFGVMLEVYGGISVVAIALSVWRLRPEYVRQLESAGQPKRRVRRRSQVSDDPIRWREYETGRRVPRWLGVPIVLGLCSYLAYWLFQQNEPMYFIYQGLLAALYFSLAGAIRASGAISSERERETWDSILITPLDTWDFVVDKHEGCLLSMYWYLAAYELPMLVTSWYLGVDAFAYATCTLLLTWTMMRSLSASGIWCSARSPSSWRSLMATMATGYGYCFAVLTVMALVYFWIACIIGPIISLAMSFTGSVPTPAGVLFAVCTTACVATSWFLWKSSNKKIWLARDWIDSQERFGRTFVRSLTRALRKHAEQRGQLVEQPRAWEEQEQAPTQEQTPPEDMPEPEPQEVGTPR